MVKNKKNGSTIYEIWPDDNYFVLMQELEPGDELVFHEGTYSDVFRILKSGTPAKPIVIRGYGTGEKRPVVDFWLRTAPIEIYASNIIIDYMELITHREGNMIHIRGGGPDRRSDNITISNCILKDSPSVVIDSNTPDVKCDNLKILNNIFLDINYTCIYIGNHSGVSPASNVLIEGNFIDVSKVDTPEIVGYGMELKLNVTKSIVRNNIVMNSQGPGIMVYGTISGDPADANIVEGNLVVGARKSAGILAGGGPSVIRDNLIIGCGGGGTQVYDYGKRNLVDEITVSGNTIVFCNNAGMVFNAHEKARSITVMNNLMMNSDKVRPISGWLENPEWQIASNEAESADTELEELVRQFKKVLPSSPDNVKPAVSLLASAAEGPGPISIESVKALLKDIMSELLG